MKRSRKNPKAETVPASAAHPPKPAQPTDLTPPRSSRAPKHLLPLIGLWTATLLCYSSSFQGGLIYDSAARILQDTRVHAVTASNLKLILKSDYWYPALGSGIYRPLTTLSFLFNYAILDNAAKPFGYHAINWILHALNVTLVYLLAVRLLKQIPPAIAVAGIWAIHPVLTESVTNVVGRADLFAGIGVLGGLLCYVKATEANGSRQWIWLGGASLATLVGIFSKESTLVVLAVVALYEFTFGAMKVQAARLRGYAALALPCLIYWIARLAAFAGAPARVIPFTDNPIANASWFTAKLTALKVIGMELWLLIWPARLSCDYSYNQIPLFSGTNGRDWAALAACLALVTGWVIACRKHRIVFFWIGFSLLALAPTANLALAIGSPMAERFLYLPAIGFAGCLVAAAGAVFRGTRARAGWGVLALAASALAFRTYTRNFDWRDENSLWSSAVSVSPASYKTHMSLAMANSTVAVREIDKAITIVNPVPDEINPGMPYVHGGRIYRELADRLSRSNAAGSRELYLKALELLLRAERIRVAHEERNRLAGMPDSALKPSWVPLDLELGRVYSRLGQSDRAADYLRASLKYRIAADLFEELSVVYFKKGDTNQAAIALLEGLVADPNNTIVVSELASLYGMSAARSCALQTVNGSTSVNLNCPMVHEQICKASFDMVALFGETGHPDAAGQTLKKAQSLGCAMELFRQGTPAKPGSVSER